MKYSILLTLTLSLSSQLALAAKVLVLRFDTEDMKTVTDVISKDLAKHEVTSLIISKDLGLEEISKKIKEAKPDLLVALDNLAVSHIKAIQNSSSELASIPAAATMALNLHHILKDAKNMCGIAYEVPAFSIVTKFRSYSGKDLKKVLTFYRKSEFNTSFEAAVNQLKNVGIELIGIDIDSLAKDQSALNEKIKDTLENQVSTLGIDAVLIPTDNIILNREGFSQVWLPQSKSLKVPFLCNIQKFASPEFDFCSFASYPDFVDLGHQFSEQLKEILEAKTPASELGVDYIVATKETFNKTKLENLGISVQEK